MEHKNIIQLIYAEMTFPLREERPKKYKFFLIKVFTDGLSTCEESYSDNFVIKCCISVSPLTLSLHSRYLLLRHLLTLKKPAYKNLDFPTK